MLRLAASLSRTLWIRERRGIAAAALLIWVLPTIAWGEKVPVGPEFQVNTYTTGSQEVFKGPSVASDSAGNFVVVWQREDGYAAVARRFSSDGTPSGPEFVVNSAAYYPEYQ
jgi:hypothetical protein